MKKIYVFVLLFLSFINSFGAAFTPGNIVVVRVGTGTGALGNTATAVFLDEYSPAGVFVQTIAMPTAITGPNLRFTNSGTATSEGSVNLSVNRDFLTLAGYDADLGTAAIAGTTSAAVKRVVAVVDENGIVNTTTGITDAFSANNIRSTVTTNGTDLWAVGGTSGVRYTTTGSSTTTQLATAPTNLRNISIYNGQLYVSAAAGTNFGVSTVGMGTPTTAGQTITQLPGFPTATGPGPYAFEFKPFGGDVIYVADDRTSALGGIQKWVLVSGTWNLAYTINPATNIGTRGLVVDWRTATPVIYATGTNSVLYRVTDNGTAASAVSTVLATAATNTAFRGVAFAPNTLILPVKLLSFTASAKSNSTVFNWKTATETNTSRFEIEQSANGKDFTTMATVAAAGNSTVEKSYAYTGNLNAATTYYRLKMIDADGKFTTSAIMKITVSKNGFALGNVYPVPAKNNVTVEWNSNRTGATSISVTDMSGRTIRTANVQAAAGFNHYVLDVQSLNAGQYFIRLKNETGQLQTIITKQ